MKKDIQFHEIFIQHTFKFSMNKITYIAISMNCIVNTSAMRLIIEIIAIIPISTRPSIFSFTMFQFILPTANVSEKKKTFVKLIEIGYFTIVRLLIFLNLERQMVQISKIHIKVKYSKKIALYCTGLFPQFYLTLFLKLIFLRNICRMFNC